MLPQLVLNSLFEMTWTISIQLKWNRSILQVVCVMVWLLHRNIHSLIVLEDISFFLPSWWIFQWFCSFQWSCISDIRWRRCWWRRCWSTWSSSNSVLFWSRWSPASLFFPTNRLHSCCSIEQNNNNVTSCFIKRNKCNYHWYNSEIRQCPVEWIGC